MNYIILNGVNSNTITGLLIQELPPISKPLMRTQIDQIDGRDGDIVTKLGYSTVDKELSIGLHGNYDIDDVIEYFASEGTVVFSNEPDKYYRYQVLDQIDFERLVRFRTATVTMHCQPFKYELNETPIEDAGSTDTTGGIVSFETQSADSIGVKVNVEPYQNLNGYASPWVGGAGTNLYDGSLIYFNADSSATSLNGITLTKNADGSFRVRGTASAETRLNINYTDSFEVASYAISVRGITGSGLRIILQGNPSSAGIEYTSVYPTSDWSKVYSVTASSTFNYFFLDVQNGATIDFTLKVQIEKGSTATAWTPYENICPIYPSNGKNLFSGTLVNGQIGSNGGYSSSTSRLTNVTASNVLGDFLKAGTYTISAQAVTSATSLTQCTVLTKDSSLNVIDTFATSWHDLPFTFTLSSDGYICFTLRPSTGNVTPSNYVAQVEHGSIATPYVPYNAIGITRTGKNLANLKYGSTVPSITNGQMVSLGGWSSEFIPVDNTKDYWVSITSDLERYVLFYEEDWSYIDFNAGWNINGFRLSSVTFWNRVKYVKLRVSTPSTTNFTTQLECNSSATTIEPYQGERYYPISANPVYGGTLEVETGVLTVTHKSVDLGSLTYTGDASVPRFYSTQLASEIKKPPTNDSLSGLVCSLYREVGFSDLYTAYKENGTMCIGTTGTFSLIDKRYSVSDPNTYKTAVTGQTLVYPLETPLVYQLTPVQVKTLLGYNNIWTDSGTVTVSVPNMISVVNEGNTTAKPTMTIYGSGNIGVWLNGMQVFQIALGDTGNITIDAEQMEAYQGGILRNRLVTGDYSNFVLQKGENTISVTGNVSNVEITNYSRWL